MQRGYSVRGQRVVKPQQLKERSHVRQSIVGRISDPLVARQYMRLNDAIDSRGCQSLSTTLKHWFRGPERGWRIWPRSRWRWFAVALKIDAPPDDP